MAADEQCSDDGLLPAARSLGLSERARKGRIYEAPSVLYCTLQALKLYTCMPFIQTLGASERDGEASERNGGARRSRGTRRSGGSRFCCQCTNLSVLYGTDVMHDNRIGR